MVFKDCYSTTVGSGYITTNIEKSIVEAIIREEIDRNTLDIEASGIYKPLFILGNKAIENSIPLFNHPLIVKYKDSSYVCCDMRGYLNTNLDKDVAYTSLSELAPFIRYKPLFDFNYVRTILTLDWVSTGTNTIRARFPFASTIYSAVVSESISNLFGLNPKEQAEVNILSSIFYQSLFDNELELNDDVRFKLLNHTIKTTKLPQELVSSVLDRYTPMSNINDFCDQLLDITGNIRFNNFKLPKLLTILSNLWFNSESSKIIPVSLEHPPTWVAMLYSAMQDRTYRNSRLSKIADRLGKRGVGNDFMVSMNYFIDDYSKNSNSLSAAIEAFEQGLIDSMLNS